MDGIIPECTGKPIDCLLCSMIGMIFEGFPTEKDPGCELGGEAVVGSDRGDGGLAIPLSGEGDGKGPQHPSSA